MNELMIQGEQNNAMTNGIISSITAETQDERLKLFDAVSNANELQGELNNVLMIQDLIMQPIQLQDEQSEEVTNTWRIVIVTDKGEAFACVSAGVRNAVEQLIAIVGRPPWTPPLPMKVVSEQGNNGWKYTTLKYSPKK